MGPLGWLAVGPFLVMFWLAGMVVLAAMWVIGLTVRACIAAGGWLAARSAAGRTRIPPSGR
jgi:hypothetical protein